MIFSTKSKDVAVVERRRPSVAIIQRIIPHYRVAFLLELRRALDEKNIALAVFAGRPEKGDGFRDGLQEVPFASTVINRGLPGGLYWQSGVPRLKNSDLVIFEYSFAAVANSVAMVRRRLFGGLPQVAYWGHGADLQRTGWKATLRRLPKELLANAPDHWFCYTELSAELVRRRGFASDKVTVVNNSMDVDIIDEEYRAKARAKIRERYSMGDEPLAVFCSRLYAGKKLNFLIEAVRTARQTVRGLRLTIIGDGPMYPEISELATNEPWLFLEGAKYGDSKNEILAAADFMVMPSWVGLSILDSFGAGLPLVTTENNLHGPEIVYLVEGVNGLISDQSLLSYSRAIVRIAGDAELRNKLSDGARRSAMKLSVHAMAKRFADGVERVVGVVGCTSEAT